MKGSEIGNEILRLFIRITWIFFPTWLTTYVFWVWPLNPNKYHHKRRSIFEICKKLFGKNEELFDYQRYSSKSEEYYLADEKEREINEYHVQPTIVVDDDKIENDFCLSFSGSNAISNADIVDDDLLLPGSDIWDWNLSLKPTVVSSTKISSPA